MADVLLVNSPVREPQKDRHAGLNPPLGLVYMAAVLMAKGYRVAVVDFNLSGFSANRLRTILEQEKPGLLGISAHTETYLGGLAIAGLAKEIDPGLPVIMGGPHPTVMYREAVARPEVDVVVRGEGEETIAALADVLLNRTGRLEQVAGIAYRRQGGVRVTPERPFIEDLDTLPLPARGLLPLDLYPYPGNMLMSRGGCPFNCAFCAVNNIWQGQRRFRRREKVAGEVISLLKDFQITEINFADDTFTLNREYVLQLCHDLKGVRVPFHWNWTCSTRVDLVDRELLTEMRGAGCSSIQFGAETGSQGILDAIGKRITLEQVLGAVKMAKDVGLEVLCSFMFPHPQDTRETIREQMRFMRRIIDLGAKITMSLTTPYPGTYYHDHADDLGIKLLARNWDEFDAKHLIISTQNLSEAELRGLLDEMIREVGLEPFETRKNGF